ncbi:Oleate-activated transcription factor 1 [Wickerhamomyces ciferrii]|uniref:Oleate activated transcription factor 3 n=1 Tax=Wickerhamomyces ciferrii (strain ATCC 14091 / BCRC 22168 / CBS 111 / JCM 3599 / NBRC 0793 / NRRL Y-1031 F-60-10) TaxID=1206466 RepID=K0KJN8_WICCF|nr:Oleate-activated transcription factor 1 [Wickerhamomyces ciferrii]CCH45480.1 Oleate-activated transcription factor 1 [Wickerhamomyces ciferrii]
MSEQFVINNVGEAPSEKPKRKRQRTTLTCLYCKKRKIKCDKAKPRCSNCLKLGRVCEYEKPTWVNTSINQEEVKTDVIVDKGYASKTRDELYQEIEYWKDQVLNSQSNVRNGDDGNDKHDAEISVTLRSTGSDSLDPFYGCGSDTLDFFKIYDSLALKHSSHEEYKPLNNMVVYKLDPYLSFFLCFRFITIQVASTPTPQTMKQNWKTRHPFGESKWFSLLDMDNGDSNLKNSIQRIMSDRSELFGTNIFPFMSFKITDDGNIQFLIQEIKEIIPTKIDMDTLLIFYFNNMWILRPFVDENMFFNDIRRIITFDDDGLKPEVSLSERRDLAVLSSLLIILRYASNSISITDDKHLSVFLIPLKDRRIPVRAITIAQLCLSTYKVMKKTTLEIVQATLFLRFYFKECPEDGDSLTLGQSQILFGSLVQSALTMGLNRDPNFHSAIDDINMVNLKRRLWFIIVGIDIETSILSGTLSVTPENTLVDVQYSDALDLDPLNQAIFEEFRKEAELHDIYREICYMINRMDIKPTLSSLMAVCDKAKFKLEEHYSIISMTPISNITDLRSNEYRVTTFKNHKILEKNIIHFCFEIVIYQLIFIHYEEEKFSNFKLFKKFYKLTLTSLTKAFDISDAYLSGAFRNFIDLAQFNFSFYPLISNLSYRCANCVAAQLVRSFHAQDLLKCPLVGVTIKDQSRTNTNVEAQDYDNFIQILCSMYENHLKLYEQVIGTKYHLSLKIICSCKFSFHSLKTHKFSLFNSIINFMEYNENNTSQSKSVWEQTERIKEIRRSLNSNTDLYSIYTQWKQITKLNKSDTNQQVQKILKEHGPNCNAIMNINHKNHFIDLTKQDLEEFTNILGGGFRICASSTSKMNYNHELKEYSNDEKFTTNASSAEDQLHMFYESLRENRWNITTNPIINDNDVEIDQTVIENFHLNDDLLNELFGPINESTSQLNGFFGF